MSIKGTKGQPIAAPGSYLAIWPLIAQSATLYIGRWINQDRRQVPAPRVDTKTVTAQPMPIAEATRWIGRQVIDDMGGGEHDAATDINPLTFAGARLNQW